MRGLAEESAGPVRGEPTVQDVRDPARPWLARPGRQLEEGGTLGHGGPPALRCGRTIGTPEPKFRCPGGARFRLFVDLIEPNVWKAVCPPDGRFDRRRTAARAGRQRSSCRACSVPHARVANCRLKCT